LYIWGLHIFIIDWGLLGEIDKFDNPCLVSQLWQTMVHHVKNCGRLLLSSSLSLAVPGTKEAFTYLYVSMAMVQNHWPDKLRLVLLGSLYPPNINQDKFTHSIVSYSMFSMKFLGRYKVVPVLSWIEFRYNCWANISLQLSINQHNFQVNQHHSPTCSINQLDFLQLTYNKPSISQVLE
jgi:hypothetical protein